MLAPGNKRVNEERLHALCFLMVTSLHILLGVLSVRVLIWILVVARRFSKVS